MESPVSSASWSPSDRPQWLQPAAGVGLVAALGLAALFSELRLPLALGLAVGALVAPAGSRARWLFSAGLPAAIVMAWATVVADRLLTGPFDCADVASPQAWLRATAALLVVATVAWLAYRLGSSLRDIGLRRPSRPELWLGIAAIAVIPLASLNLGTILAKPFFGEIGLDLSHPAAIVPAVVLAVANGIMEELAYRGALMHWLSRASGPMVGLVGQAVVFGLAHTGSDFTGPVLPVALAVGTGGLIAGLIVRRTGSLWLPIVVHICFDIPLYYAAACRL